MREKLIALLKTLEEKSPPPAGCHHSITYNQYGSDADGWEDKLGLHVWIRPGFIKTFWLDEGDFEKTPEELAREVLQLAEQM